MRRGAKNSRVPLAPLHNNSLRADVTRPPLTKGKEERKSAIANRSKAKIDNALKLPGPASADLSESRDESKCKTGTGASPAKTRKSSQLVTTSAASRSETIARIKKAVKKPAGNASAGPATRVTSAASRLNAIAARRQAVAEKPPQQAQPSTAALTERAKPEAGAVVVAPGDSLPKLHQQPPSATALQQSEGCSHTPAAEDATASAITSLKYWHMPATPPSVGALLGPLESPQVASTPRQDVQYLPLQQAASPSSGVVGTGTPQDFSDVFNLDEVHMLVISGLRPYAFKHRQTGFCALPCSHACAFTCGASAPHTVDSAVMDSLTAVVSIMLAT